MKHIGYRFLAMGLVVALTVGMMATAAFGSTKDKEKYIGIYQGGAIKAQAALLTTAEKRLNETKKTIADKTETVYVVADASGAAQKVIVSDWLTNPDGAAKLADSSNLSDIQVVEGDATSSGSGESLVWEAGGGDVYYQGTSDQNLPVDVTITYYLDGKEISPDDLSGKSGKLTIDIDYQNNEKNTVDVDGESLTMYTPFLMMTGLILDNDCCSNVQIDNGTSINDGNHTMIMGYALPGLKDSLNLDALEASKHADETASEADTASADAEDETLSDSDTQVVPLSDTSDDSDDSDNSDTSDEAQADTQVAENDAESTSESSDNSEDPDNAEDSSDVTDAIADVDIPEIAIDTDVDVPESVKITADVTDFSLSMTMTVAMCDVFNNVDFTYANGTIDSVEIALDALSNTTQQLVDGTVDLADGITQLRDGANDLGDGADTLADGASDLNDGAGTLADGAGTLASGAASLSSGAATLTSGASSLQSGAAQVSNGASSLSSGINTLQTGAASALTGSQSLTSGAQQVSTGATSLSSGLSQLETGAYTLTSGTSQLVTGAATLSQGVSSAKTGADTLAAGLASAQTGANDLEDGISQLSAGAGDLASQADSGFSELSGGMDTAAGYLGQSIAGDQAVMGTLSSLLSSCDQSTPEGANLAATYQGLIDTLSSTIAAQSGVQGSLSSGGSLKAGVAALQGGLSSGVGSLSGGISSLYSGATALSDGIDSLAGGASSLSSGLETLSGGMDSLSGGISQVDSGAQTLSSGISTASSGAKTLSDGAASVASGSSQLQTGISSLYSGSSQLASGAQTLASGASSLYSGASNLYNGASTLSSGVSTLSSGASALSSGASTLYEGTNSLVTGVGNLKDGTQTLKDGVDQFYDGAQTLSDGMKLYQEKGISKICDLYSDNVPGLIGRIEALQQLGQDYKTFTGLGADTDGTVRFLIRTGAVGA